MSDNKTLTDEQYYILLEGETHFVQYSQVQYTNHVEPRFKEKVQRVYQDFYGSPLNINCGQCMGQAWTKLWHHMGLKKYELEQRELKLKQDAQRPIKKDTGNK